MLRILAFVSLVGACDLSRRLPPMEGQTSSADVSAEAQVWYTHCDGAPCTSITVELRRDGHSATDTTARVSVDDGPLVETTFKPHEQYGGGEHSLRVDGWIDRLHVEATAGSDSATLSADAAITTPDDAAISLPDSVTLGARPPFRWRGQGRPYFFSIVYATDAQASGLRFGFLTVRSVDDGSFDFDRSTFASIGSHTVGLFREIDHEPADDDSRVSLIWGSMWQKKVLVVESPQR